MQLDRRTLQSAHRPADSSQVLILESGKLGNEIVGQGHGIIYPKIPTTAWDPARFTNRMAANGNIQFCTTD